jgi:hemerythrin-like domain-containing protein
VRPAASRRGSATRATKRRPAATTPTGKPSRFSSAATAVRGALAGAAAALSDRLPWGSGELDAIALLEKDHRRFEELLKQGEQTTERAIKGRTALLDTLTAELNQHELVEEQILYPALKSHPEAKDIVLEGYQEHHVADVIVLELHTLAKDDEKWGAKFKVLKESLEHHIQEEEGEMFPTARGIFSREDLRSMGAQMARLRAGS